MEYIDTHCHLADEAFGSSQDSVIERALRAGVSMMLQADIDSSERDAMFAVVDRHPDCLRPMLGLYPGSVGADWQDEIDKMIPWLDLRDDIVAIGEIGLDYHYGAETAREQKEALRVQLEIASVRGLPVNIHLREATADFLDVLESCKGLDLRGNMHAYSGSYETWKRLQKYGQWYLGIGGVVTFKNASLQQVVRDVPAEWLLLETDAPYLTPVPHRGTRNESAYIPLIAAKVAELKGIPAEEVAQITTANARKLFQL